MKAPRSRSAGDLLHPQQDPGPQAAIQSGVLAVAAALVGFVGGLQVHTEALR